MRQGPTSGDWTSRGWARSKSISTRASIRKSLVRKVRSQNWRLFRRSLRPPTHLWLKWQMGVPHSPWPIIDPLPRYPLRRTEDRHAPIRTMETARGLPCLRSFPARKAPWRRVQQIQPLATPGKLLCHCSKSRMVREKRRISREQAAKRRGFPQLRFRTMPRFPLRRRQRQLQLRQPQPCSVIPASRPMPAPTMLSQ